MVAGSPLIEPVKAWVNTVGVGVEVGPDGVGAESERSSEVHAEVNSRQAVTTALTTRLRIKFDLLLGPSTTADQENRGIDASQSSPHKHRPTDRTSVVPGGRRNRCIHSANRFSGFSQPRLRWKRFRATNSLAVTFLDEDVDSQPSVPL